MRDQVTTGIEALDTLIDGLFVGDNVIWYDDAGSLADVFYLNLIRSSQQQDAPLIVAHDIGGDLVMFADAGEALTDACFLTVQDVNDRQGQDALRGFLQG